MKADQIIKNAKIFTSNKDYPQASALVVKDGKFVYVGDEAGLSDYEGEVTDLGGKFIMPGIIDSHVHITTSVAFDYVDLGERVDCSSKQEALDFMAEYIRNNPGVESYRFMMGKPVLNGEELVKEDLDAICPDSEIVILEEECHSVWVNSRVLENHGITDDTPDPAPEICYYVRKDGHLTGNAFEAAAWPFLFAQLQKTLTDEQIEASFTRWIDFCKDQGVCAVFDAGFPEHNEWQERFYKYLQGMDKQGKLPVYVDGCYFLTNRRKVQEVLDGTKRWNREFTTEHMKVHTFKLFNDGTQKIHTAAMVTPYADTGKTGATTLTAEEVADLLMKLNEEGLDLHVHTVGEQSSRAVLDGVEMARKELGDDYHVRVTCAHLEVQVDSDLDRFAELGVIANFTPWWNIGGDLPDKIVLLGEERARKQFRCRTMWDTGALVAWSSDNVAYLDFAPWNPYLGMEIGMTRCSTEKTNIYDYMKLFEVYPPENEVMTVEEMILGYTINGAIQLGIEDAKGSIEAGKDADFLVFDNDLLTAEHEGFSNNKPSEVYFSGKKMK